MVEDNNQSKLGDSLSSVTKSTANESDHHHLESSSLKVTPSGSEINLPEDSISSGEQLRRRRGLEQGESEHDDDDNDNDNNDDDNALKSHLKPFNGTSDGSQQHQESLATTFPLKTDKSFRIPFIEREKFDWSQVSNFLILYSFIH